VEYFKREYGEEEEGIKHQEWIKEKEDFSMELVDKYTAKLIHGWENRRYEKERE